MTAEPVLVLLHGAQDQPSMWDPHRAALGNTFSVLTPRLVGLGAGDAVPFTPADAGHSIGQALTDASANRAFFCGVGVGALVAMNLAADEPERVSGLALLTQQTAPPAVLMSLPAAVLRLLPAATAQRLGVSRNQVIALLDQVRPVDISSLAPRVQARAVVLRGAKDRLNARASSALAQALPHGQLTTVPTAGPSWWRERPQLLTDALCEAFLPTR